MLVMSQCKQAAVGLGLSQCLPCWYHQMVGWPCLLTYLLSTDVKVQACMSEYLICPRTTAPWYSIPAHVPAPQCDGMGAYSCACHIPVLPYGGPFLQCTSPAAWHSCSLTCHVQCCHVMAQMHFVTDTSQRCYLVTRMCLSLLCNTPLCPVLCTSAVIGQ